MFSWTDISDHKGGVLLLSCILLAQSGVRWSARRAGVIVGGPKRLYALSTAMATAVMTPWALYHHEDLVSSHYSIHRGYFCFNVSALQTLLLSAWSSIISLILISISIKIIDFYVESAVSQRPDKEKLAR